MKQKIKQIIFITIIVLFSYGIINNVKHFIEIRKTHEYSFDNSIEIVSIKKSVLTLNNDIEKLKKIENSSLGNDVLKAYIQMLENLNSNLNKCEFMSYKGNVELSQKDLYQMLYDYGKLNYLNLINVYKKLIVVKPTLQNSEHELIEHIYTMMLLSNYMYENFINNYEYNNLVSQNEFIVSTILSLYQEKLATIHDVTELVILTDIGSGDINE